MVVFDATTLLYLLDPEAKAPTDPEQPLRALFPPLERPDQGV
jgi:hypothetical protein